MNKVKKVCKHCRSEDVRKDAWTEWDEDKQEWVLCDIFENDYCINCAETTIVDDDTTRQEAG